MCDEISTERDSSRVNSLNSSTISSRTIGSRPFVGSSSSRSFASCASAAAIETFILLPRESSANGFFCGTPSLLSSAVYVSCDQRP